MSFHSLRSIQHLPEYGIKSLNNKLIFQWDIYFNGIFSFVQMRSRVSDINVKATTIYGQIELHSDDFGVLFLVDYSKCMVSSINVNTRWIENQIFYLVLSFSSISLASVMASSKWSSCRTKNMLRQVQANKIDEHNIWNGQTKFLLYLEDFLHSLFFLVPLPYSGRAVAYESSRYVKINIISQFMCFDIDV